MSGTDPDDGAAARRQEAANRRIHAALEALGDLAGAYRLAPEEAGVGDADLAEDVAGALEAGSEQLRAVKRHPEPSRWRHRKPGHLSYSVTVASGPTCAAFSSPDRRFSRSR